MRRRLRLLAPFCVVTLVAAGGVAAGAQSAVQQILNQCPSGQITGRFTVAQLRTALRQLPTSVNEYTSCSDVINRAILTAQRQGRTGGSGGGSGGSFLPVGVIVVLAVLVAAALGFGVLAVRNRRSGAGGAGGSVGSGGDGGAGP